MQIKFKKRSIVINQTKSVLPNDKYVLIFHLINIVVTCDFLLHVIFQIICHLDLLDTQTHADKCL